MRAMRWSARHHTHSEHPVTWEELLAGGRVRPPTDATDIADEEPGVEVFDASAILAVMRELDWKRLAP
jgi:hypothetical protein